MKTNKLWDDNILYDKETKLYIPEKEVFHDYNRFLNYSLNAIDAINWVKLITNSLVGHRIRIYDQKGNEMESSIVTSILTHKKGLQKADRIAFLAFFFAHPTNMNHYIQSLPDEQILLWKTLIQRLYADRETLKKTTGKEDWIIETSTSYFYRTYTLSPEIPWCQMIEASTDKTDKYGFRMKKKYLMLPPYIRIIFAPAFFPDVEIFPRTRPELPEEDLYTFHGEASFHRYYPLLRELHKQGIMCLGKNKMLLSTIKNVAQKVGIEEFFKINTTDDFKLIRASLILPFLTQMMNAASKSQRESNAEDFLILLMSFIKLHYQTLPPLFLPHITGIKNNLIYESTLYSLLTEAIGIFNESNNGWIYIDDMVQSMLIYPHGYNPLPLFKPNEMDKMDLCNKYNGELVCIGNALQHLGTTCIKAFFYLLGGLGILELAYRLPELNDTSVFYTLQYVRLTELGKYALGITTTYTPPQKEEETLFLLDNDRLVIRSLKKNNPYESLLTDIAVPIGNHRYLISSESFLKHCTKEKDVKDKIEFFQQFICKDLPDVCKEFFNSLIQQCHPLKTLKNSDYVIYQIDGNNKRLIQLLATDSHLKSIIIRAEGYRILVEKSKQKKFIDMLKSYGYLL